MRQALARRAILRLGLTALLLLHALSGRAQSPVFPRPPEIEPLISFWVEIFTQHEGDRTILHDKDDPGIRYETVATTGMTEKIRRDLLRGRRSHYVDILENLALKPAVRWNEEENRIAALFPAGSGTSRFLVAAGNVRMQRGIRDQFRDGLIRSGRWKSTIEGILTAYGIPVELAALPHIESSYNPGAASKAGALGVWQFTTGTGRRFLRIDRYVDERRDAYLSTHAAARYLKEAYGDLGSWALTVTSYNHGVSGMLRAQRELGTSDIARLIREYQGPYFGFASKNFYAEFLAALDVLAGKEAYFGPLEIAPLESVERFVLPGPASFPALVKAFSTPIEELRSLNPALAASVLAGRVAAPAGVVINVPGGRVTDLAAAYASLPAQDRYAKADPDDRYRVRMGDTLSSIARHHRVSVSALQAANGLGTSTRLRAGQRLTIPEKNH